MAHRLIYGTATRPYLVVFDARVDMIGEFLVAGARSRHTVIEKIVDVRSRVKLN
jgi:hypothetical protein